MLGELSLSIYTHTPHKKNYANEIVVKCLAMILFKEEGKKSSQFRKEQKCNIRQKA